MQPTDLECVLRLASDVFGSRDRAERWLMEPAMSLEQRRPLDVLAEAGGAQRVMDALERMLHGVYQ